MAGMTVIRRTAVATATALADPPPVFGGHFPDPAVAWAGSQCVATATGSWAR